MLIARETILWYNNDAYGRRLTKGYTYDPNPAVTSDTSYTYNITYDYDNSGRLIREYCTGAYTFTSGFSYTREFIYLYDENEIIGVLHSYNGAALKPYYFHKNLQGDVIAICDENGNVVAEYAYDAWGNCTVKKSSGDVAQYNPIRYRSYYWDRESNLYFVGGRYYDPTCGRFISPDSVANLNPSAHVGLNLYLYAGNDPVNGVYGGANDVYESKRVPSPSVGFAIPSKKSELHWKSGWGKLEKPEFLVFSTKKVALIDWNFPVYKTSLYFDEAETRSLYITIGNISAFVGCDVEKGKYGVFADAYVFDIGYDGKYFDASVSVAGVGFILAWENGSFRAKFDPPGWFGVDISVNFGQILEDLFG